ncbi:MAG: hypothetical protein E6J90_36290, partial [Deltaproteobacteria bacterium]
DVACKGFRLRRITAPARSLGNRQVAARDRFENPRARPCFHVDERAC